MLCATQTLETALSHNFSCCGSYGAMWPNNSRTLIPPHDPRQHWESQSDVRSYAQRKRLANWQSEPPPPKTPCVNEVESDETLSLTLHAVHLTCVVVPFQTVLCSRGRLVTSQTANRQEPTGHITQAFSAVHASSLETNLFGKRAVEAHKRSTAITDDK